MDQPFPPLHSHGRLWSNPVRQPLVGFGWRHGFQELLFGSLPLSKAQSVFWARTPSSLQGGPGPTGSRGSTASHKHLGSVSRFQAIKSSKQRSLRRAPLPLRSHRAGVHSASGGQFVNLLLTCISFKSPPGAQSLMLSWLPQSCSWELCLSTRLSPLPRPPRMAVVTIHGSALLTVL